MHLSIYIRRRPSSSDRLYIAMQVFRTLTAKMEAIAGARVEHNKYCLSVHFRCVREEVYICIHQLYYSVPRLLNFFLVIIHIHTLDSPRQEWNAVNEEVRSVLREYPNLKLTHGRKVRASYVSITSDDIYGSE